MGSTPTEFNGRRSLHRVRLPDGISTMPDYQEEYPKGTEVRVADLPTLERFRSEWKYHHPLSIEQLEYATREAKVSTVGYYHGGDVLYTLEGVPGIWHEACLLPRAS